MAKLRILFVDDDINITSGLNRTLFQQRSEWDTFFVNSGVDALAFLEKQKVDIIISDMRMPQMNGADLLLKVKDKYPEIIRVILSGYSDLDYIYKVTNLAHQSLTKPVNADVLKDVIKRLQSVIRFLRNDKLITIINDLQNLPVFPDSLVELDRELKSPDASISTIGEIISKDIGMTSKILKLVNSAFFGLPQRIVDPVQAVNYLGTDVLKSLILFENIFAKNNIQDDKLVNYHQNIRNHSLNVGLLAKEIASLESQDKRFQDEAFISGLLHDLGKVILLELPEYLEMINHYEKVADDFVEMENEIVEVSHTEVGAYFSGLWNLPDVIMSVTEKHHTLPQEDEDHFLINTIIYYVNKAGHFSENDIKHLDSLKIKGGIKNKLKSLGEQ